MWNYLYESCYLESAGEAKGSSEIAFAETFFLSCLQKTAPFCILQKILIIIKILLIN